MSRIENGINNYLYGADGAIYIRADFAPAEAAYSDHINSSIRKQGSDAIFFNANRSTEAASVQKNPMAGHANGESIRPYTILSVPIFVY